MGSSFTPELKRLLLAHGCRSSSTWRHYGAVSRRYGALQRHFRALPKRFGAVWRPSGALRTRSGALQNASEAFRKRFGALLRHSEALRNVSRALRSASSAVRRVRKRRNGAITWNPVSCPRATAVFYGTRTMFSQVFALAVSVSVSSPPSHLSGVPERGKGARRFAPAA